MCTFAQNTYTRTHIMQAIQSGRTVPVNLTISILSREIEAYVAEGKTHFVLDGFPRTKAHFDAWIDLMSMRADVPIVINLDAPLHVCETRSINNPLGSVCGVGNRGCARDTAEQGRGRPSDRVPSAVMYDLRLIR